MDAWTCRLTLLALIPALLMFAIGTSMGKAMTRALGGAAAGLLRPFRFRAGELSPALRSSRPLSRSYKELQAFRKLNKENEEINVTYTKIATLLEVLVTLFVESVICIILGYGGYLVYQGRFNAGQLVEYIGYFEAIVWPIMAVSMLIEKTSRGKASLNRITELLDAPIDVADRPGVADLTDPARRHRVPPPELPLPGRRVRCAAGYLLYHLRPARAWASWARPVRVRPRWWTCCCAPIMCRTEPCLWTAGM